MCRVGIGGGGGGGGAVSKSHKFKGLVMKVGASKGVTRVDLTKRMTGGGGFQATRKPPCMRRPI